MPDIPVEPDPPNGGARRHDGRTVEERRARRRQALLDAGLEAFGTRGYRATTVEQLCRAAAVSTRNFYEEFTNREELLLTIYDELITEAVGAVMAQEAPADVDLPGLIENTRRQIAAFVEGLAADPRAAQVVLVEVVGISDQMEVRRRQTRRQFAAYIASQASRFAEAGRLPRGDFRILSIGMVGAIAEVLVEWVNRSPDERFEVEAMVDALHRTFLAFTVESGPDGWGAELRS